MKVAWVVKEALMLTCHPVSPPKQLKRVDHDHS